MAEKGRSFILEQGVGSVYTAIGGARDLSLSINNTPVDITNKDSAGIRQLLEGAGTNSVTVSASGIYVDETTLAALRTAVMANTHAVLRITDPATTSGGVFEGTWMITSIEFTGGHESEMGYSMTFESAGTITFT